MLLAVDGLERSAEDGHRTAHVNVQDAREPLPGRGEPPPHDMPGGGVDFGEHPMRSSGDLVEMPSQQEV
jgi:hypothetical protein